VAAVDAPSLFVVHAPEDAWFVEGFLLAALQLPAGKVVLSCTWAPGALPRPGTVDGAVGGLIAAPVGDIERGARATVTVVVVSPAFLASTWALFAEQVAAYQRMLLGSNGAYLLVPAVIAPCELPLQLKHLTALEFFHLEREHWEAEVGKLSKALAAPLPPAVKLDCPYPGIRPFTTDNAAQFFGREDEVADLVGRLRAGQREVYVIGPSGSGKSSLVAAGLVPQLRNDAANNAANNAASASGGFLDRQMRPGADPTAALAGMLEASPGAGAGGAGGWLGDAVGRVLAGRPAQHLLIVVDQLEELFTTADAGAREAFIAAVRVLRGDPRVALVLTLRADFYAALMESALWTDLGGQLSRLEVGPLRGAKLRAAIEAPARALGVYFEPVLVERLLHDVADEPGALPLLQDTLVELWQQRTRGLLRLTEYVAMGDGVRTGLAVTVARRADGVMAQLSPGRREIARRVLLRLVQFDDGAGASRRQQSRAALATAGDAPAEIDAVVRYLADQRLISTSAADAGDAGDASQRIDLAHEILLTAWPALAEWIRSRRQDEQRRRALEDRATEWVARGRGSSRLLDADEVHEARSWLTDDKARDLGVSEEIQSLLVRSEAALAAQVAEAEGRRRTRRRVIAGVIAGLAVAVVSVSVAAVIAVQRSHEATEQAAVAKQRTAEAQHQAQLAAEQSREARRQLARNYLVQGQALLLSNLPAQAAPYLVAAREVAAEVRGSAAGRADDAPVDRSLRMLFRWAAQGVPLVQVGFRTPLATMALSPDGTRIATAHRQGGGEPSAVRIWDRATGRLISRFAHEGTITEVAWSPDGRRVASAGYDRIAQVWDPATGKPVTPPMMHRSIVDQVAWSPDGTRLATRSELSAQVWDAATGKPAAPAMSHSHRLNAVAWSPDGTRLATAAYDDTAQIWDARTGQRAMSPLAHGHPVELVAWSPDGKRVATAADEEPARIWDASTGRLVASLGHNDALVATPVRGVGGGRTAASIVQHGSAVALAWSPDGTRLATGSEDQTAQVWDAATGKAIGAALQHKGTVVAVAWKADGSQLATASGDGTARIWDAATGDPVTPPMVHQDTVRGVRWSPDGTRLATASRDGTAWVWDASSGQPLLPPLIHQAELVALAWTPDGTRLVTASHDSTARVWNAAARPPLVMAHDGPARTVAWSPDGARLLTASGDHTARVWDARTGQAAAPALEHKDELVDAAWSPDGTRVATASRDGTARVWDARTGEPVTEPLVHGDRVTAVAWRPDGAQLATASADGTARIWDSRTGEPACAPFDHGDTVDPIAWRPDGRLLATACLFRVLRWDPATGSTAGPRIDQDDFVFALAWRRDGAQLATGARDGLVQIWSAETGARASPAFWHRAPVQAVAWSPDGTELATASADSTARVWNATSGQAATPALVHHDVVNAVAWSPDGTRVATASSDATARVWDAVTGLALTPPLVHEAQVHAVAWSPDGTRIATASEDSGVRVYDASWDTGTLEAWRGVLVHCDYALNRDGVLITRDPVEVATAPTAPPPPAP
jgi:WD40 repeat protein